MPGIRSTLRLNDAMSGALRKINSAMELVLTNFEAVQRASGNSINIENISEARREIAGANAVIEEMERSYRAAEKGQNDLNQRISEGNNAADGLLNKVKGIASAYAIKKGADWISGSIELFDTQMNSEAQLKTVLNNVGAEEGAMDRLKKKASEIQGLSVFGDEAMLGGAGEFATYMSDDKAIAVMMDSLANYAAGMSGGGEVSYKEMVDYATGLGKVVNGSFDAMTKKGFAFSDQQKQILKTGTDMEKALVISDVVNESWGGLAAQMANLPAGRIIQLKNTLGDMREDLAARIYPMVMKLFDEISSNTERTGKFISGLAKPINLIISLTIGFMRAAGAVADFIAEHWSVIGPIIGTVTAAVAALTAATLIYNAVQGISNGIHAISAAREALDAGATLALAAAKKTATGAQVGMNAALLACPITWIILAVVALIAIIIAVIVYIAKAKDSSLSTLGAIMGALYTAGAGIWNLILGTLDLVLGTINYMVNPFIAFANFVANVFRDPVGSVVKLFGDMADRILRMLQSIASALDKIFGSNLAGAIQGWRDGLSAKITAVMEEKGNGQYKEVISQLDLSSESLGLKRWDYADAWKSGTEAGNKLDESMNSMFDADSFLGSGLSDLMNTAEDISDSTGSTAKNTEKNSEELAYLRDIAEKEAINRFTTAEITVDMTGMTNRIDSDMDLDGIISRLTDGVADALITAGEGVY